MSNRPIHLNAQQYNELKFTPGTVATCFEALDKMPEFSVVAGEISVAFMNDTLIAEVHERFLEDPTPTDVITFEGDPEMEFAGEICVSVDHALSAAENYDTTFREELTLYLVHGYLHLAGLDDVDENDRKKMREAEALAMSRLKEQDCLPDFSL